MNSGPTRDRGDERASASFSEQYARKKPPRWRRILSVETLQSILTFVIALALLVLVAYLGYVALDRSGRLANPPRPAFGSTGPGPPEGTLPVDLVSEDGTSIAGWYVPSTARRADTAVVLVHGWGGAKGDLVPVAKALRSDYDVLLIDLRGHGYSGDSAVTLGPAEAEDVSAAVDEVLKRGARKVALFGVGMGGAAALAEARGDPRVGAVAIDAPWPRVAEGIAQQLEEDGLPLSWPGDWAVVLGMLFRTGRDVTSADVADSIGEVTIPVLLMAPADDPLLSKATLDGLAARDATLTTWTPPAATDGNSAATISAAATERLQAFLKGAFDAKTP